MKLHETKLRGVYFLEPLVLVDPRGWFMESYNKVKTPQISCEFVQDNHSYSSAKGTLRGIHFQYPPMEQAKLVRCVRGAVLDFVVDLRRQSDTFRQWIRVELSAENRTQVFVPRGFGHAFITTSEDAEVVYKADNYYSPQHNGAVLWCDPDIGVDWGTDAPILSEEDKNAPLLAAIDSCSHGLAR